MNNNIVHECFSKYHDKVAVVTEERSYTFSDIGELCDNVTTKIPCRSLVFILCDNNIESLIFYLSTLVSDNLCVLLSAQTDPITLNSLIELYQPKYVLGKALNYTQAKKYVSITAFGKYNLFQNEKLEYAKISSDLKLLMPTSGSTGSPKFVRLTLDNIVSNAFSIIEYLGITPSSKAVTSLPMHYSYGLSVINTHFLAGGCIILTNESITNKAFWDFGITNNFDSFAGVPYTYYILDKIRFWRNAPKMCSTFTQAGGKMSTDLIEMVADYTQQNNNRFFVMYGQTEATARISYLDPKFVIKKLGSIGKPIPGGKLRIHNTVSEPDQSNKVSGELQYSGRNVFMGYAYNFQDLCLNDTQKGILNTGDLGYQDNDGFFYITGRKNRFVKVFGNRYNLDYIEEIVKHVSKNVACVGEDDQIRIFIDNKEIKSQIYSIIKERIQIHPSALKFITIDALPRAESGKVLYSELQ